MLPLVLEQGGIVFPSDIDSVLQVQTIHGHDHEFAYASVVVS
jgi:hypothetical protein